MKSKNTYSQWPDEKGYFGQYGGRYVAETLMPLIKKVEESPPTKMIKNIVERK